MNRASVVILAIALALPCAAKDKKQEEAQALFARAAQVQGIAAPGAPPFQLRMTFQVVLYEGPPLEGNYLLLWASANKWRSELNFPNYNEVRFGGPGKMWRLRSSPSWPSTLLVPDVRTLAYPKLLPDERAKKLRDADRGGIKYRCVLLQRPGKLKRVDCFDLATGVLVREERPDAILDFSDFRVFGDKRFPRTLTIRTRTRNMAAKVEELVAVPPPDDLLVRPPGDAQEWPTCEGMTPARLTKDSDPAWPKGHYGESSSVLLAGVVEVDGKLSHAEIAESGGSDFDAAALKEVKKWRFRPAACDKVPIRQEVNVEVVFGRYPPLGW